MKTFITVAMTAIFAAALRLDGTTAYSALSLPPPRLAPAPILSTATTSQTHLARATTDLGGAPLQMAGMLRRVFRRAKGRLQTLDKEGTATKRQKDPERPWRVLFHNSEYRPDSVSRVLTKVLPISRATAFEVCLRARNEGTVVVMVTDKKKAEKYCGALLRRGLTATIEPYEGT